MMPCHIAYALACAYAAAFYAAHTAYDILPRSYRALIYAYSAAAALLFCLLITICGAYAMLIPPADFFFS